MVSAFLSEGESPGLQHSYDKSQPREDKGIEPLIALSFNEMELQIADLLTKSHTTMRFRYLVSKLQMLSLEAS